MQSVETVERVLELAPHGRLVNTSVDSQVHWRGQKAILHHDENDPRAVDSVRMRGDTFFEVEEVSDDYSNVRRLTSCAIDAETGRILVAPTGQRNTKMTIAQCKDSFIYSVDRECKVRVAVIFSEEDGIEGVDLGWYTAVEFSGRSNGCFLVLERDEELSFDVFPFVQRIGQPTVVTTSEGTTVVTNSAQEGRFIRLFDALGIPFIDENRMTPIRLPNGTKYPVDYMIYPEDPEHQAYVEVKPFRPTDVEIMKAGELHRSTGVDVYIVWGEHFVPGLGVDADKWTPRGEMARDAKYISGIRGARIFTNAGGEIDYEDGYYFMANDKAGGNVWEEEETGGSAPAPTDLYRNRALARYLERGGRTINKRRRARFEMRPTVRAASRVVTTSGRRFRPVDTFKAHLYRFRPFALHKPSSHLVPGPGDWNSDRIQAAFRAAREGRSSV